MKTPKARLATCFLCLFAATLIVQVAASQTLQLLSARDHIDGSFTTSQSIYAYKDYIYLASWQGRLFILERNRGANFPLIERIQVSSAPLTAVSGDANYVYVTSSDGALRVYQNQRPFLLVNTVRLYECGLASVAAVLPPSGKGNQPRSAEKLYASKGQTALAAGGGRLYFSELNSGEGILQLASQTFSVAGIYGQPFQQNTTAAFDVALGQQVGAIPNPVDLYGRPSQVSIYADSGIVVQTTPGCCGQGILIWDPGSLMLQQFIPRWFTNTVQRVGQWLIAGNENGAVDVYDLSRLPSPRVSTIDLRQLTGYTGADDIEVRALWGDSVDGLIFAASSWSHAQTPDLFLPSFFVLKLALQGKR